MALKYIRFNIFQELFHVWLSLLIYILFSTNIPSYFYQCKCCCATRDLLGHQGQTLADRANISLNSFPKATKLHHKKTFFFVKSSSAKLWNMISQIFKNHPFTSCLRLWTVYLLLFLFQHWPLAWRICFCFSFVSPPIHHHLDLLLHSQSLFISIRTHTLVSSQKISFPCPKF